MERTIRYSGIAVLSVSLIMLSLGSIPQTFAGSGSVPSTMTVVLACGLTATGSVTWGSNIIAGSTIDSRIAPNDLASTATIENTGNGLVTVDANTGDDGVGNGGGYSEVSGAVHILNPEIDISIGEGDITMLTAGADVEIGTIAGTAIDGLDMVVRLNNLQALPTLDNAWSATITLTATDCELV